MKGFKSFTGCAICGGISIRVIIRKDKSDYGLCRDCYDSEYRSVKQIWKNKMCTGFMRGNLKKIQIFLWRKWLIENLIGL